MTFLMVMILITACLASYSLGRSHELARWKGRHWHNNARDISQALDEKRRTK